MANDSTLNLRPMDGEKPEPTPTKPGSEWGSNNNGNAGTKGNVETLKDGNVIVKGYGSQTTTGRKNLSFTSASDIKYLFIRLNNDNDPDFLKWAKKFGSIKNAQKYWNAAADYSYSLMKDGRTVDFFKTMESPKFVNYTESSRKSSGPSSQSFISITTKRDAKIMLEDAMMQTLNRKPTAKEIAEFTKQLNSGERKNYRTTLYTDSAQTTTGSDFDPKRFLNEYVLNKVSFKKDLQGQAGYIQDYVNGLVNDNGLNGYVDDKSARNWMRDLASGKITEEGLMSQVRDKSQAIYVPFADMLKNQPDKSLNQVASQYLNVYQQTLELPDVNVKDALSKAIKTDATGNSSVMSVFEFEKSLRKDERYQYTSRAKQEATNMAQSFARAFGVNV